MRCQFNEKSFVRMTGCKGGEDREVDPAEDPCSVVSAKAAIRLGGGPRTRLWL
jgi:hypothetical protein